MSNNIIVDNGKIKEVENIKQLRNILGVELADNLISCEKVLLVEGPTDVKLLSNLLPLLRSEIKEKIKNGKLIILSTSGTKNLIQYANFYKNVLCDVVVLTDLDTEGRRVYDKILSDKLLDTKSVFFVNNDNSSSNKDSELENIIKPNYIQQFITKNLPEFSIE
jgi:predicted ATP-dependent endonuclease of OLD family